MSVFAIHYRSSRNKFLQALPNDLISTHTLVPGTLRRRISAETDQILRNA